MLERILQFLAETLRVKPHLYRLFGRQEQQEIPDLGLTQLIRTLYRPETIAHEIIPKFFVIPKMISEMPDDQALFLMHHITSPLFHELPWVAHNLASESPLELANIDNITAIMASHEKSLSRTLITLTEPSASELRFQSYVCTVIAYIILDYVSCRLKERFSHEVQYIAEITQWKNLSERYLEKSTVQMTPKKAILAFADACYSIIGKPTAAAAAADVPEHAKQVEKTIHHIRSFPVIKHSLVIRTLDRALDTAGNFDSIKDLLIRLIQDEDKPLVNVALYHPEEFQTLVSYIFHDKPTPKLCTTRLSLLQNGLKPNPHQDPNVRFGFVYALYNNHVLMNKGTPYKGSVMTLLINTFLEERGNSSSPYVRFFMRHLLPHNNFDLALAVCLSTIDTIPSDAKKRLFVKLMDIAGPNQEIVEGWIKILLYKDLPVDIEVYFYGLFKAHIDEGCFGNPVALSGILRAFYQLLEEFWSTEETEEIRRSRLMIKINHIALNMVNYISHAQDEKLTTLFRTLKECDESTNRALFIILISAKAFANPLKHLLNSQQQESSVFLDITSYKPIYLRALTNKLAQLDPRNPRQDILNLFLEHEDRETRSKLILLVLMVVSRNTTQATVTKPGIWIQCLLSIIKSIVIINEPTEMAATLSTHIAALNFSILLPKTQQKLFLKTLQPPTDCELAEITDDSGPAASAVDTKKSRRKRRNRHKKEGEEIASSTSSGEQAGAFEEDQEEDIHDTSHSPVVTGNTSSSEAINACESLSRRESPANSISTEASEEEPLPATELLKKSLLSSIHSIQKYLTEISRFELPRAFDTAVSTIKHAVECVAIGINMPVAEFEINPKLTHYQDLDNPAKLKLEDEWNKHLAKFSWHVQRAIEKYQGAEENVVLLKEEITRQLKIISHCYYKNPRLHISSDILRYLDFIQAHFQSRNIRVTIKGSYFSFPDKACDIDLMLIANHPDAKILFDQQFTAHANQAGFESYSTGLVIKEQFNLQRLCVRLTPTETIDIDFICWNTSLSSDEELNNTALAHLSTCAVNWYLDGHACILPAAARAICCNSPVLKLLNTTPTADEYKSISGYLLKNIIKLGGDVRHDPFIKSLLADYINPESRIANRPDSLADDVLTNRLVVNEVLDYLLTRFHSKTTTEMIRFILKNSLLSVAFQFPQELHEYFTQFSSECFFIPTVDKFPGRMSGPVFLSMYFLGGIAEKSEEERSLFIEKLQSLHDNHQNNLKNYLASTIKILQLIPSDTSMWGKVRSHHQQQKLVSKGPSYYVDSTLLILDTWFISATSSKKGLLNSRSFFALKHAQQSSTQLSPDTLAP